MRRQLGQSLLARPSAVRDAFSWIAWGRGCPVVGKLLDARPDVLAAECLERFRNPAMNARPSRCTQDVVERVIDQIVRK